MLYSDGLLCSFKNARSSTLQRVIPVGRQCLRMRFGEKTLEGDCRWPKRVAASLRFSVINSDREYHFCCESERDLAEWQYHLSSTLNKLSRVTLSKDDSSDGESDSEQSDQERNSDDDDEDRYYYNAAIMAEETMTPLEGKQHTGVSEVSSEEEEGSETRDKEREPVEVKYGEDETKTVSERMKSITDFEQEKQSISMMKENTTEENTSPADKEASEDEKTTALLLADWSSDSETEADNDIIMVHKQNKVDKIVEESFNQMSIDLY